MTKLLIALAVTAFLAGQTYASQKSRTRTGKISMHDYGGTNYVTAARGVNRGALLWVWNPAKPNKKLKVKVVDACGYPMKRMGRHLDGNRALILALYGSTKRGVWPVRWSLIKDGTGPYCGRAW